MKTGETDVPEAMSSQQRQARINELAEANAYRRLQEIENANVRAHFLERHGAQTSLESQLERATNGTNPTTGETTLSIIPFDRRIGEGYSRVGPIYGTSNTEQVVLDKRGNPVTAYPAWGE